MKKTTLNNFWFYYKKHLMIGLAVLLVLVYLGIQKLHTDEPDYHIGLVRSDPLSEEALHELETGFTAAGSDLNGDGQVLVQIHSYYVDLADDSENAGVNNAEAVQALDADLIGNVSGIFLLEDVDTFQRITNGILSENTIALGEGLTLTVRKNASAAYFDLMQNFS